MDGPAIKYHFAALWVDRYDGTSDNRCDIIPCARPDFDLRPIVENKMPRVDLVHLAELLQLTASRRAVSYTHLDVYKRQVIDNAGGQAFFAALHDIVDKFGDHFAMVARIGDHIA